MTCRGVGRGRWTAWPEQARSESTDVVEPTLNDPNQDRGRRRSRALSTRLPRPSEPGLVSDQPPPDPDPISTVAASPRIVGRMERPSREPEQSTDGYSLRRQSDPLLVAIGAFRDFVRLTIKGATCRGTLAFGFVVVSRMTRTGDPIADVALVLFALYLGAILGRPLDRWISKLGPSRRAAHESVTNTGGALIAAASQRNDQIDQNRRAVPAVPAPKAPRARAARRRSRPAGQRGHP